MIADDRTPDYAARIQRLRRRYRLSQGELAARLGATAASVSQWERGRVTPSQAYREQIDRADLLGLHAIAPDYAAPTPAKEPAAPYDVAPSVEAPLTFTADPEVVRLVLQGHRLAYGHQTNPTFATETAKIAPLPHQHTAVYERMLPQSRLRFLLADDAGAGKTIMAGLYIREMLSRRLIERVLVVPPAGLVGNWASEMHTLFSLPFRPIDGQDARDGNPFVGPESDLVIVSVDTLDGDRMFGRLQAPAVVPYDLVIVDEAHKLSASQGPNYRLRKTQRYRLAEALAGVPTDRPRWQLHWSATHLLLLTATPHMGKDFPYYCLWRLLEPEALATYEAFKAYPPKARRQHFIRRTKEEMVDLKGEPIYPERVSNTLSYALTQGEVSEARLYEETTAYLRTYYNRARMLNRSAAKLAMGVFQRRLASSTYALRRSLDHRVAKLSGWIRAIQDGELTEAAMVERQRGLDELRDVFETTTADEEWRVDGREAHEVEEERALGGTVAVNLAQLEAERREVVRLRDLARQLDEDPEHEDAKFERLREVMRDPTYAGEKMIIFTEHRDTLTFLVRRLQQLGFHGQIARIHGAMPYPAREEAVAFFRKPVDEGGARYLVATDAAGEGINLQFCWLMVNYDVPWNPARLEQRMGRIHRYGQEHDPVVIVNLIAEGTREGKVLKTLLEKLEAIRRHLGKDKVFDVVGRLFRGISIKDYMARILERDEVDGVQAEVDRQVSETRLAEVEAEEAQVYGETEDLARELPRLQEAQTIHRFRRLLPGNVRRYLAEALPRLDLEVDGSLDGVFSLRPRRQGALDFLWPALEGYPSKLHRRMTVNRSLPDDAPDAVFVRPGEAVFDALVAQVDACYGAQALAGSTFVDPLAGAPYLFHLVRVEVVRRAASELPGLSRTDVLVSRLLGLKQDAEGRVERVPVEHLLLLRGGTGAYGAYLDLVARAEALQAQAEAYVAQDVAAPIAEARRVEMQATLPERLDAIGRGYDYQAAQLAKQRTRYREQMRRGTAGARARYARVKRRQRELAARRQRRLAALQREPDLIVPRGHTFLAHALVMPSDDPEDRKVYDKGAEEIAMRHAIAHEEDLGARVVDVHTPPLARAAGLENYPGFDLLAYRPEGQTLAIEVKGHADKGGIELSFTEMMKAMTMEEDYWVYVVQHCATPSPDLVTLLNPVWRRIGSLKGHWTMNISEIEQAAGS